MMNAMKPSTPKRWVAPTLQVVPASAARNETANQAFDQNGQGPFGS